MGTPRGGNNVWVPVVPAATDGSTLDNPRVATIIVINNSDAHGDEWQIMVIITGINGNRKNVGNHGDHSPVTMGGYWW